MANQMEEEMKNHKAKGKMTKRKEKKPKPRKLNRGKSMRSVGSFVDKVFKTLGTLARFGDISLPDAEDDDGGFRDCTPCTSSANTGQFKEDSVIAEQTTNNNATLYHHASSKARSSWCCGDKIPGVLGLKNHGNTCFMNAVVQCLSNTDLLAEYLGLEKYRSDLNRPAVNGIVKSEDAQCVRGEVTEQLAALIRALWTLEYTPQLSVDFKTTVSKYSSQFRGNSQHDALEFLLWLLNRLHEDISSSPCANGSSHGNSSGTKVPGKGPAGAVEPPVAGMAISLRAAERPSFVQEHFQAQYKSCLTCPHCLKQSNTFDPFLCISLPIPLQQTRPLYITLVFSTKAQRFLRVGLEVPLSGPIACLRRMVADEGKLSPDQIILTEVYSTGFHRSFFDDEDLTNVVETDIIYAFQAPPLYWKGGLLQFSGYHHSLPSSPYSAGPGGQRLPPLGTLSSEFLNQVPSVKVVLLVCNAAGVGQQAVRFGPPFLMREDRGVSWEQLQQTILSRLSYLMIRGAQTLAGGMLFRIRVVGASMSQSYLSPQDRRPLYHPVVDRVLRFCGPGGPPHVKLIIEWDHRVKERLFGNIREEVVQDCESVRAQQQQQSCTLDDCFQLYTKEEQLAPEDAWRCPHCQRLQQGTVQVSLWTLPDILVLHLKRFRQAGGRRHKLPALVRFPLAGLDTAPHVERRGGRAPLADQTPSPEFLYDLYAVCNHHGGMHGGHYTAYCRNSVDGKWYRYDDSAVDLLPEAEVCTRDAYILFYQRRNAIPPWSASCSVRGSTSSSLSDHWLARLGGDDKKGSQVSRVCTNYVSAPPESPVSLVFQEEPPLEQTGESLEKPIVRETQGRSVSLRTPPKAREGLSKVLPLRWSLGSRGNRRPCTGQLVEYLESGRRPRCTQEPIIPLWKEKTLPDSPQRRDSADRCSEGAPTGGVTLKSLQAQGGAQGSPSWRGSSVGPIPSPTPPLGWDPFRSRSNSQSGPSDKRVGGRGEQPSALPLEEGRGSKVLVARSLEGRRSFIHLGFLRRDPEGGVAGDKENRVLGDGEVLPPYSPSSIQARSVPAVRRLLPQVPMAESPTHTALNTTCYSSTSLGRKRPVPESIF
ncbi:ubiquitin carboxyl-terminal hydrolase 43-like isoform X2 [Paramormyrops kingsleyae]|uniref:ubiquitinyl hydrolase 1 n=1 Tax=Paramormyrops kingsleyae TaxID=1676925 RepID=A0A3B3QQV2_9TELE|nr:ubiquitin carboxyl-terminal hydrolase 43-like isoform X2 [Paramormyrops kingsleyae]